MGFILNSVIIETKIRDEIQGHKNLIKNIETVNLYYWNILSIYGFLNMCNSVYCAYM